MGTVELEIPPRSAYVGVVRLALSAFARSAGLDEETVDDLRIALSEACTNAVRSHERAGREEPVTVRCVEEPGRLTMEVGDRGPRYNPGALDSSDPEGVRLALSVALLESLAECEFTPRRDGGMCARLSVPI